MWTSEEKRFLWAAAAIGTMMLVFGHTDTAVGAWLRSIAHFLYPN